MLLKTFALYDSKAKVFGPPFYYSERGQAIRELKDVVESKKGMVGKHPEDFVMYQISTYDDNTGEFKNVNPHELVAMATDYKKEEKQLLLKTEEQNLIEAVS